MKTEIRNSLDSIIQNISMADPQESLKESASITIRVPKTTKMKYEKLQEMTGQKVSKAVRELLIKSVDRIGLDLDFEEDIVA